MRNLIRLPVLLLFGCDLGPVEPIDTDIQTIPPTTTGPTTTPPQFSDEGSVMLMLELPDVGTNARRTQLAGVFDESNREWSNLAHCLAFAEDGFCATTLPADLDDYVDVEMWTETLTNPIVSLDVGPAFSLGSYTAPKNDQDDLTFYFDSNLGSSALDTSPMDLRFAGGVWGEWTGTGVATAPTEMALTLPDPSRSHTFTAETPVVLEWENAAASEEVYLAVLTPVANRLYLLEDDGSYELDLVAMGLQDTDSVRLMIGRWTTTTVDFEGNAIDVHVQTQQYIEGEFRDLSGRTELFPEDSCADAGLLAPLTTGSYFGKLESYANDHNPGNFGCTGWPANGQDGVLKVELGDQSGIDATYRLLNGDASLYLLEDCNNTSTCVAGADQTLVAQSEHIAYYNNSGQTETLWLILDAYETADDLFELDVSISRPDVLLDACADAIGEAPTPSGLYNGDLTLFHNYTDPAGACAGTVAPGQDGITKVELTPYQTLSATVTMPGNLPIVYLLYNCAISASCATQSGYPTSDTAQLQYQNTSQSNEVLYLVADGLVNTGPYTMDLQIQ